MALLAAYTFDEASGDYLDATGNGHDFSPAVDGTRTASGTGHGDVGRAFTSTADSATTELAAPAFGQTTDRTVMCWIKGDGEVWHVRWNIASLGSGGWGLLKLSGGVAVQARNASGLVRATTTWPSDGAWHHVAATYVESTSSLKLYLDGVLTDTQTLAGPLRTDADEIDLGEWGPGTALDDLRIYDEALDAATIAELKDLPAGEEPAPAVELALRTTGGLPGHLGATPGTSAAFTPAAGEVLVATVMAFTNGGSTPFASGFTVADSQGLTWSEVATVDNPLAWSFGARTWVSTPAAAVSTTVTFGCGAVDLWDMVWDVLGATGTSGEVVGLVVDNDAPVDGGYDVTLAAAPTGPDAVVFGRIIENNGTLTDLVMPGGWTTYNTSALESLGVAWRTGATSTTVTVADTNASFTGVNHKAAEWAFVLRAAAPRVNLCTNPHADVDASGWTSNNDSQVRVDATGFPKGHAIGVGDGTGGIYSAAGAVAPGAQYTLSAQIKNTTSIGDAKLYIEWRDAGGGVLDYTAGTTFACPFAAVTPVSVTGTAPVGASAAALLIAEQFGARQVGAVLIEPGAAAHDYADGDTDGWHWDGTPGLSASGEGPPTAVVVAAGQAVELDAAQPIGHRKVRTVGQAVEVALAQPMGRARRLGIGQAVEVGTARTVGRVKTRTVAAAVELSTATAVTARHIVRHTIGQAVEQALAAVWTRRKLRTLGRADELDRAEPVAQTGEVIPPTTLTTRHHGATLTAAHRGRSRLGTRHG